MGTNIEYNGVTLNGVYTRVFDQQLVADDSDTDLLYSKFIVAVECLVHTKTSGPQWAGIAAGQQDLNATALEKEIRSKIGEFRGDFRMTVDGITLLEADKDSDANNGPKPRSVQVRKVSGGHALQIYVEFEICKNECGGDSNVPDKNKEPVISNRWSASETFDERFFRTRKVQGRLRVAHLSINPQTYRNLVIPPLAEGYKRIAMDFVTDPSGLNMDYVIVDQQVYAAPPQPAKKWSAQHIASMDNGLLAHSAVNVRLEGDPNANKAELLSRCVEVINSRIGDIQQGFGGNVLLKNLMFIDHLHLPVVEAQIAIDHVNIGVGALGGALDKFGTYNLANYGMKSNSEPVSYGPDEPVGIFIAMWQNPCGGDHDINSPSKDQDPPDSTPGKPRVRTTPDPLDQTPTITTPNLDHTSRGHDENPYMGFRRYVEIDTLEFSMVYPVASPGESGPQGVDGPSRSDEDEEAIVLDWAPKLTYATIHVEAWRVGAPPEVNLEAIDDLSAKLPGAKFVPTGHKTVPLDSDILADGKEKHFVYVRREGYLQNAGKIDHKTIAECLKIENVVLPDADKRGPNLPGDPNDKNEEDGEIAI